MKISALTLIFSLICAIANAGWHYQSSGSYYVRVNEYGQNDGCYYTYYCGRYYYAKAIPVTVNYNKNWKDDLVNAIAQKADNEQFRAALSESGLIDKQTTTTYPQNLNGISVLTQGLFGQGSTTYGALANFQPQMIDWQAYQNSQLQFQNRAFDAAQASNNGVNINIKAANESNTDLAKFAAGVQGIVATATATVTPKQQVTQFSVNSGNPPPAPVNVQTTSVLPKLKGEVLVNQVCAKCHSGAEPKGKEAFVDLVGNYNQADRLSLSCEALSRMTSDDPNKMMPPPSANVKFTSDQILSVYSFLKGD